VTRVCLAGATGWAGAALARAIAANDDLALVAAVGRRHAGRPLGEVLGEPRLCCPIHATVSAALAASCDVFVEYTKSESAKANVQAALARGAHAVIGTSGLGDADFAALAAKVIPHWEILDYAHADKPDAPSGTARELAARLAGVRQPAVAVPVAATVGPRQARGATLGGAQVHSIRLPGFVIGAEVIFGLPGQRLCIRHDAGGSAEIYVDGALLAIRKVAALVGVHRGLDVVLEL
jgi:4-hydroxy-tetrahydrodipicolinate reductase